MPDIYDFRTVEDAFTAFKLEAMTLTELGKWYSAQVGHDITKDDTALTKEETYDLCVEYVHECFYHCRQCGVYMYLTNNETKPSVVGGAVCRACDKIVFST